MPPHTPCRLELHIECLDDLPPVCFGIDVERTRDLFYCWGGSTEELGAPLRAFRRGEVIRIVYDFVAHFARGHYRMNVNVRDSVGGRFWFFAESVVGFTVHEEQSYDGVAHIAPVVRISSSSDTDNTSPADLVANLRA